MTMTHAITDECTITLQYRQVMPGDSSHSENEYSSMETGFYPG